MLFYDPPSPAFLSAPSCKSGGSKLQLAPLGRLSTRQQWRIVSAATAVPEVAAALAAGDGIEDDLVGQPVFIQVGRVQAPGCQQHATGCATLLERVAEASHHTSVCGA